MSSFDAALRLNAKFFWGCLTCRRAFARRETAAQCHRPPEGDLPTVAAPQWSARAYA